MKRNIDFIVEEKKLISSCKQALKEIKEKNRDTKKIITAKPKKGALCVIDALDNINLLTSFMKKFSNTPVLITHKELKAKTVPAQVYTKSEIDDRQAFLMNLFENMSTRVPNDIEKSIILKNTHP